MTSFTLTFKVVTTSPPKAAALRDKAADWLNTDDDVSVVNQAMSQDTQTFTVIGVDVAGKERFSEPVEASDEAEAEKLAVGKSQTKVVATVTRL